MRCNWCNAIIVWIVGPPLRLNPGPLNLVEEMQPILRRCQNIKSRKNPDVQCPLAATNGGDYCTRHQKNPRPFGTPKPQAPTREAAAAATTLQRFWKRLAPLLRFKNQGPAANAPELSVNDTELYSFNPLSSIPKAYFISFADTRRQIWVFDIRTLAHSMGNGFASMNPYNRETLSEATQALVHRRLAWLRSRGFQIQHIETDVLTPEQIWNQRVLDAFLKIEALGYYANCEWFQALRLVEQIQFYRRMYGLWSWRLGLSAADKESIVPLHDAGGVHQLFRYGIDENLERPRGWWARHNMALIEAFISRGATAEHQKLGAMYVLMGLVQVSQTAAEALPWVSDLVNW